MGKGAEFTVVARHKKPRVEGFRKCETGLLGSHRRRLGDSARAQEDQVASITGKRNGEARKRWGKAIGG